LWSRTKAIETATCEWPAILRWAIDGCLDWQSGGLRVPAIVTDATNQYLADQNIIKQWADEWLQRDPGAFEPTTILFAHWKNWNELKNQHPGSEREFVSDLADLGYRPHRTKHARGFKDVLLRSEPAPPQDDEAQPGPDDTW
jgi:putative DNA primase/helicase